MKKLVYLLWLWCVLPVYAGYAFSLGQKPLYSQGFTHFSYVNPNAPKGGSITLPVEGGFDTLNPFTLKGNHENGVAMLTLDTLVEQGMDDPFAVYPLLAQDMILAADGLSVTFRLNPKARFHNGDPVLAKDVVYSFDVLTKDPAAAPFYRIYWADVARVEVVDNRTVRFRFKKRNAELHLILGSLNVFSHKSFPKGLAAAGNTLPIGSGPYRLTKTESGRLAVFHRDNRYWAADLPTRRGMYNFDVVRMSYFRDPVVRIEGMKSGSYDLTQENVARNWARAYPPAVLARRGLVKRAFAHHNTAGMQGFVMNHRRALFQDVRVRRALVESFDFESINRKMFYGLYRRSNSFFTNSEMAATGLPDADERALLMPLRRWLPEGVLTENVPEPPVTDRVLGVRPNLLRARALFQAAGYRYRNGYLVDMAGRRVEIEYLTPSKSFERIVAKWQRDLAKIGVTLRTRVVDSAVYQKRLNDFDFDLVMFSYANSPSPGNEQFGYYSCQAAKTPGSMNLAGVCDPAVERLLKHFEQFGSRRELITAARALDRVLRHQCLVVPNWYTDTNRMVYRKTLGVPPQTPKYYYGTDWAVKTWWDQAAAR